VSAAAILHNPLVPRYAVTQRSRAQPPVYGSAAVTSLSSRFRERAELPLEDAPARRERGAALLDALRALAREVERVLPELGALTRFATRPEAASLAVGWRPRGSAASDAPRLALTLHAEGLDASWGFGSPRASRSERDRHLAEGMRRRRSLGEALVYRLGSLRAEGARLHPRHGDTALVSEEEWLRAPAGVVAFTIPASQVTVSPVLVRLVADRAARLASLGVALGAFALEPSPVYARAWPAVLDAVRSLRWDERALGEGAPPAGLVPIGRRVVYDPVTGWFAPEGMASLAPSSAPRIRLLLDLGIIPTEPVPGPIATVGAGLHTRLARWLTARGSSSAHRDATHLEVRVAAREVPPPGERPALETLVSCALEDPSGDTATALAGLLAGAPWSYADPLDPTVVASKVASRYAPAAARGVSRLIERGVLVRGVTGTLDAVGECLTHPAIRPVVALAVERALGHFEALPPANTVAPEARLARAWELASGTPRASTLESLSRRFVAYARAAGLAFELDLVRAFVVGLAARPFAVLTGVSGTGKTALALAFARFMTDGLEEGASARVAVVPVRPDWLDSRGLLGYLNALRADGAYEDTAALRVMLRAVDHPNEAHFLVLDEMNLARVEHYLAEVLSAMESGAPIPLHGRADPVPTTDGARTVPPDLTVPANLFVIGTVNLDETTHALSLKVLDRAWVWEFPTAPPTSLLRDWLGERRAVSPATPDDRRAFLESGHDDDPVRAVVLAMGRDGAGQRLDRVFEAMSSNGRPFGFRVTTEALRFVSLCEREGIETPPSWRLDRAVLGKVLPRLSGTRRDLEALLRALLAVFLGDVEVTVNAPRGVSDEPVAGYSADALVASAAKVREMLARLEREPFVTFAR
jgi:hypothetical protein